MNSEYAEESLQQQVYKAIKGELAGGRLKSRYTPVRIYLDKAYAARDGWGEGKLEISVEAGTVGGKQGSLLLALACLDDENLDASGLVTVEAVETFQAVLDKIGGPVKGLIATSGAWKKDAFKIAGSLGIGIVRLLPPGQVLWLNLNMSPLSFREYDRIDAFDFKNALLDPAHIGQNRSFYGFCDHHLFGDWLALLTHIFK